MRSNIIVLTDPLGDERLIGSIQGFFGPVSSHNTYSTFACTMSWERICTYRRERASERHSDYFLRGSKPKKQELENRDSTVVTVSLDGICHVHQSEWTAGRRGGGLPQQCSRWGPAVPININLQTQRASCGFGTTLNIVSAGLGTILRETKMVGVG